MDLDQRALDLIREWESVGYETGTQQNAALQCLIIAALGEQHELTKLACCEAVKDCEETNTWKVSRVRRLEAMGACLCVEI